MRIETLKSIVDYLYIEVLPEAGLYVADKKIFVIFSRVAGFTRPGVLLGQKILLAIFARWGEPWPW
jgi:hypothetical protein